MDFYTSLKPATRSYGAHVISHRGCNGNICVGLAKLDLPVTPRPPAPRPCRPAILPTHAAVRCHLAEPPVDYKDDKAVYRGSMGLAALLGPS